jgi:hypothetical protein
MPYGGHPPTPNPAVFSVRAVGQYGITDSTPATSTFTVAG